MFTDLETLLFILCGLLMWRLRRTTYERNQLGILIQRVARGYNRLRLVDDHVRIEAVEQPKQTSP